MYVPLDSPLMRHLLTSLRPVFWLVVVPHISVSVKVGCLGIFNFTQCKYSNLPILCIMGKIESAYHIMSFVSQEKEKKIPTNLES